EKVVRDREKEDEAQSHAKDGDLVTVFAIGRKEVEQGNDDKGQSRQRRQEPGLLHTDRGYHRSVLTSSTLAVSRLRNTRMMIPSARPTSAAATVMTKMAKMTPRKSSESV